MEEVARAGAARKTSREQSHTHNLSQKIKILVHQLSCGGRWRRNLGLGGRRETAGGSWESAGGGSSRGSEGRPHNLNVIFDFSSSQRQFQR